MCRLENLSGREGLTVVRLCVRDLLARPSESFQITANRVIEKNAELCLRLS